MIITNVTNESLQGKIERVNEKWKVEVTCTGYGEKSFYDILNDLGLIETMNNMNNGDAIVFNN